MTGHSSPARGRHRRGSRGDKGDHSSGPHERHPADVGHLEKPAEEHDGAYQCQRTEQHTRGRELQAAAEDQ